MLKNKRKKMKKKTMWKRRSLQQIEEQKIRKKTPPYMTEKQFCV